MKKGCFLTLIIVFTVVVGAIFFIAKYYGDDILNSVKDVAIDFSTDDIIESMDEIKNNEYKDSLKVVVNDYLATLREKDFNDSMNDASQFFEKLETFLKDKQIDSVEFSVLKKYAIANEKSEESGN